MKRIKGNVCWYEMISGFSVVHLLDGVYLLLACQQECEGIGRCSILATATDAYVSQWLVFHR